MMRSLFSGVAGLKTHQTKMDVIGNNISNVNTVAFKSSGVNFADIMYQTTSRASGATEKTGGVNAKQIGLGVATASTKVKITNGGSAQSTGDALDIRLSDANSTNFFIVNNGTQNYFTRDGSLYIDGNGNLAMTSTGYLVQGWQVNKETLTIQKDIVSSLRVMDPANLTSNPEATKNAMASGLIDKNDSNVSSSAGYIMSLSFYDKLGYAYTAKFSVKGYDVNDTMNATHKKGTDGTTELAKDDLNTYSVQLDAIYDSEGNDILATYMNNAKAKTASGSTFNENEEMEKIFGTLGKDYSSATDKVDKLNHTGQGGEVASNFALNSGFSYKDGIITKKDGNITYTINVSEVKLDDIKANNYLTFVSTTDSSVKKNFTFEEIYSIPKAYTQKEGTSDSKFDTLRKAGKVTLDNSTLRVAEEKTSYYLNFQHSDGSFGNIAGDVAQSLKMSVLGEQFENISIDFTSVLNYDNGGTSTMGLDRGSVENASVGAGKKLGAMTGISIQQNGEIYGSYDNGNTVLLGQIAVAQFANASGLESIGNNCYNTTLNSGEFDGIGVDITADGGKMNTGQLEMSNVDLSNEFTDMITTQRGFQANSRIISVSDSMLEELTNLKR